jgi:Zn finger protein HypA/HybF involved in hydrogenase expression
MAKIMINCRKCGKDIRLDLSDSRALCRKCRKTSIVLDERTTRNFDF